MGGGSSAAAATTTRWHKLPLAAERGRGNVTVLICRTVPGAASTAALLLTAGQRAPIRSVAVALG